MNVNILQVVIVLGWRFIDMYSFSLGIYWIIDIYLMSEYCYLDFFLRYRRGKGRIQNNSEFQEEEYFKSQYWVVLSLIKYERYFIDS